MSKPWSEEELAWAKECLVAGDSYNEIAEMSGRTREDVYSTLSGIPKTKVREARKGKEELLIKMINQGIEKDVMLARLGMTDVAFRHLLCRLRREGLLPPAKVRRKTPTNPGGKQAKESNSEKVARAKRDASIIADYQAGMRNCELHHKYQVTRSTISGIIYRYQKQQKSPPNK